MWGVNPAGSLSRVCRITVGWVRRWLVITLGLFRHAFARTIPRRPGRRWRKWRVRVLPMPRRLDVVVVPQRVGRMVLLHCVNFCVTLGTQVFHDVLVIWFGSNFVNELSVGNFPFRVDNNHGSSQ